MKPTQYMYKLLQFALKWNSFTINHHKTSNYFLDMLAKQHISNPFSIFCWSYFSKRQNSTKSVKNKPPYGRLLAIITHQTTIYNINIMPSANQYSLSLQYWFHFYREMVPIKSNWTHLSHLMRLWYFSSSVNSFLNNFCFTSNMYFLQKF